MLRHIRWRTVRSPGRPAKDRGRIVSDEIGVAFGEQRERLGVTVSNALCRHDVTYQIDAGLKGRRPSLVPGSSNRWDPQLAQPPGSQPGQEVLDDHCRPIHRARHDPARLHRRRTARPRRVPRPDQGGLRTRPAPVHDLVPCSFPAPVRGPPRRHRVLRPRPGGQGDGPGRPSPGGCAPSPGSASTRSKRNSSSTHLPRTSAVPGPTTSPMLSRWTVTSSAPYWSPPGSNRRQSMR
jgi:hypothetical protein